MKKDFKQFIDETFNKSSEQLFDLLSERQPYKSFIDKIMAEIEICYDCGKENLIENFEELEKKNPTKDEFKDLFINLNNEFILQIIVPHFRMRLLQESLRINENVVDEEVIEKHIRGIKDVLDGTLDTHGLFISPILEISKQYEKFL